MQLRLKQLTSFHWLTIIVLAATLTTACNDGEKKTETESVEVTKDSMPPLDTDTMSTTRPETIKNGTPQQQQQ